jgi:hypothetical protein
LVESDESFVRDDAAALQPSLIALQLPLAPMRALECGALHSFCDPARSGTIAAFAVWSFVSVLIVPARKLGLGASYPRRFGRLFCEPILSSLAAARLSRRRRVPFTRSAFADELSALSKRQKIG